MWLFLRMATVFFAKETRMRCALIVAYKRRVLGPDDVPVPGGRVSGF